MDTRSISANVAARLLTDAFKKVPPHVVSYMRDCTEDTHYIEVSAEALPAVLDHIARQGWQLLEVR